MNDNLMNYIEEKNDEFARKINIMLWIDEQDEIYNLKMTERDKKKLMKDRMELMQEWNCD